MNIDVTINDILLILKSCRLDIMSPGHYVTWTLCHLENQKQKSLFPCPSAVCPSVRLYKDVCPSGCDCPTVTLYHLDIMSPGHWDNQE